MNLRKSAILVLCAAVVASVVSGGAWSVPAVSATALNPDFNAVCTQVNLSGSPLVIGTNCRTVSVGGDDRKYIVVVPPHGLLADPHDMVFVFHGTGGDGGDFSRQLSNGWTTLAATRAANFITVFPTATQTYVCDTASCGYKNRFNGYGSTPTPTPTLSNPVGINPAAPNPTAPPVDDEAFFEAMYDDLTTTSVTTVGVNLDRIFAAGFSSGACMALTLGYEQSDKIDGVAAVVGCAPEDPSTPPARHVPISYSVGASDTKALGIGGSLSLFPGQAVASPFGTAVFEGLATKSGRDLAQRRALQWPVIQALATSVVAGIVSTYPALAPLVPTMAEQTWIWWATSTSGVADAITVEVTIVAGAAHTYTLGQTLSPAAIAWAFFNRTVPR